MGDRLTYPEKKKTVNLLPITPGAELKAESRKQINISDPSARDSYSSETTCAKK